MIRRGKGLKKEGWLLVEVVLAIVILSVGLVTMVQAIVQSASTQSRAEAYLSAMTALHNRVADVLRARYRERVPWGEAIDEGTGLMTSIDEGAGEWTEGPRHEGVSQAVLRVRWGEGEGARELATSIAVLIQAEGADE